MPTPEKDVPPETKGESLRRKLKRLAEAVWPPTHSTALPRTIAIKVRASRGLLASDMRSALRTMTGPALLLLGIGLAMFQQWCGINVIFNYAEEVFRAAGYDISKVLKQIAWTGSVNLLFTFVALATVDRIGRRPLLLLGAAGLAVIYVGVGLCYHAGVQGFPVLTLVLAAIACYSMSLAPVVWVVISEIFPNRIRGAAMSVAVAALWIACFILTYTFPILNAQLGPAGTFWLYAGICVIGFVFILFKLPETKHKTLEQLEKDLVD